MSFINSYYMWWSCDMLWGCYPSRDYTDISDGWNHFWCSFLTIVMLFIFFAYQQIWSEDLRESSIMWTKYVISPFYNNGSILKWWHHMLEIGKTFSQLIAIRIIYFELRFQGWRIPFHGGHVTWTMVWKCYHTVISWFLSLSLQGNTCRTWRMVVGVQCDLQSSLPLRWMAH